MAPIRMTHRTKSDLYTQLAALERAGIPSAKAFRTLANEAPIRYRKSLESAAALAERGQSLTIIGVRTGVFDRIDTEVLNAAGVAGRVEQGYRGLAERHRKADLRQRRVRAKMMLPAFVFIAGAFIRPIPALFSGQLHVLGYLAASVGLIAIVGLAILGARGLWRLIRPSELGERLGMLGLRLPVLGQLQRLRNRTLYLEALAMLIESGVPALKALSISSDIVPNRKARIALKTLTKGVEAGQPLHLAFQACPWIDTRSTRLLAAGEASGTLSDMLARISAFARDDLEALEDALATWLPRIAYFIVALWVLSGISPETFSARVPADL